MTWWKEEPPAQFRWAVGWHGCFFVRKPQTFISCQCHSLMDRTNGIVILYVVYVTHTHATAFVRSRIYKRIFTIVMKGIRSFKLPHCPQATSCRTMRQKQQITCNVKNFGRLLADFFYLAVSVLAHVIIRRQNLSKFLYLNPEIWICNEKRSGADNCWKKIRITI